MGTFLFSVFTMHEMIRKKVTRKLILAGLLLVIFHFLSAQEKQILFTNIDKSIGLSHNHVICFLKDKKGFLWIGTMEGLCRFDGYSFKVFKNDPDDPSSLKDNTIISLFEDPQGKIWIKAGKDLHIYDPATETIIQQQSLFNGRIQVPAGSIWIHFYDNNQNILFANDKTGTYKYIVASDSVVKINFSDRNPSQIITYMGVSNKGDIWYVCRNSFLYKSDGKTFHITDSIKLPYRYNNRYRFYIDGDNDLWIYDLNNSTGVIFFNTASRELNFLTTQSASGRLTSNKVTCLTQDEKGLLWIGTDHGGINIVNKSDLSVKSLVNDPLNERSLCDNSITSLYKDYQGYIWIGSYKRGVSYYHKDLFLFDYYKIHLSNSKIQDYNDINNFAEDKNGNIWIGTNGGGLLYFNRKENTYIQYVHDPSDPSSISANTIIGLYIDSKERLWTGTYFGGLNLFDGRKFQHFRHNPSDSASLSDDCIWDICEDNNGKLWIATLLGGVNIFDPDKKRVIECFRGMESGGIKSDAVFSVIQGKDNTMWFATVEGLRSFDLAKREFHYYNHDDKNPCSLSKNLVLNVLEDSRGFIWATTIDGLNRLDRTTGEFEIFRQRDGLPSNFIINLTEDNQKNLWMCTSNGISKLTITWDAENNAYRYAFKNFDKFDGLQGNEFNEKAIFRRSNGKLLFGGPNGFNSIDPEKIDVENIKSNIVFTDFLIFNKSINNKKPFDNHYILKKSISYTSEIRLKHNENVFTIEFSNLNYIHPERRHYLYRLDNFKDEWFTVSSRERKITYTNLNPGKYVFRVKSTNNDGTWNDQEAQLSIIIQPPWWNTLIFKIFSILFIISSMVGFYYFRLHRLRLQKKILETRVKERTNELYDANYKLRERQNEVLVQNLELEKHRHKLEQLVQERTIKLEKALKKAKESDQLKSAFLANMSHEIRTPMNAIIGFSSLLDDPDVTTKERSQFIRLIHANSESLLMLINDILDFSLIEANQLIIRKENFELNDLANQLLSYFKLSNKNPGLEIKINHTLSDDKLVLYTDKFRLKQILTNFMSNACKYTASGYVEFGIVKENDKLNLYVKDTGMGIASDDIPHLFERFRKLGEEASNASRGIGLGLAISKKLSKLLGGEIEVQSTLGEGSVFAFKMPYTVVEARELIMQENPKDIRSNKLAGKRILIVEDEEDNFFYLQQILEKVRTKIIWAKNGQEAVNHVKSGIHFDLVLMDIKMPEMNGIDALKQIKAINPGQLVIAQTAYARTDDETIFRKEGFDDYLAKPIKPMDLIVILEKHF
ncbi:MAG: response regulator [Bacteroidales bacterium]|nr:response regulator [Bacteroidales bacterium]